MAGDFGTTSDFHAKKKATDYGDYRLSEYPATFGITSDYQIFTHPATMKQVRKSPGLEKSRCNRTSVLVYSYIHNKKDTISFVSKKNSYSIDNRYF